MAVELDLGPEAEQVRAEVRAWIDANRHHAPDRRAPSGEQRAQHARWADLMTEAGLVCVAWPEEHGGRGWNGLQVAAMNEEFTKVGVPRVTRGMGESLVGPAIIAHGTEAQQRYFLPRIRTGEDRYCQGFSEPGAGSDLAAVQTRGVVEGDELVVTGQKVWTSWYTDATMVFTLVRTDPAAPKHAGISYVLIPIRDEVGEPNGVEFRPLRQMTGEAHFAETFLDEARAPLFNVIGGLDNGWRTAMTTLGNERGGGASTRHLTFAKDFHKLVDEARTRGLLEDPLVRQDLARAWTHVEIMRFQGLRVLSAMVAGKTPGAAASGSKMFWSEYQQWFSEMALRVIGRDATEVEEGYGLDRWQRTYLNSRASTIWGGTAEIQRNIIGERVLGLPKEPRHDRRERQERPS